MKKYHTYEGEETITIEIGKSVALVLSDLLWRWEQEGFVNTLQIDNDAESHTLSIISGALETQLSEPFRRNYIELVQQARERLIAMYGKLEDEASVSSSSS